MYTYHLKRGRFLGTTGCTGNCSDLRIRKRGNGERAGLCKIFALILLLLFVFFFLFWLLCRKCTKIHHGTPQLYRYPLARAGREWETGRLALGSGFGMENRYI